MFSKTFVYCSIAAIIAAFLIPPDRTSLEEQTPLIRGAQINYLETNSWAAIEKLWDDLKATGVNTVIIRVFKNHGDRELLQGHSEQARIGVYFRSEYAPVIDDLLGPLTNLSHAKGMKIFAWMTTRNCLWNLDEKEDLQEYIYDFAAGGIVPGKGLNIFHPKIKNYLIKLYQELARYPIDGILIQDDLILRHNEGFNPIVRARYPQETGNSLLPSALYQGLKRQPDGKILVTRYTAQFWHWTRWKEKYLQAFLRDLISSTKSVNPNVKIALNIYYEYVTNPEKALAWYSQNLSSLLSVPLDYFVVMAYHRQIQKELGLSYSATHDILRKIPGLLLDQVQPPEKAVIKLQMIDWDTGEFLPRREIEQTFDAMSPYRKINLIFTPTQKNLPLELIKKYYLNR